VGESTKNLLEPRIIGIVTARNLHDPKAIEALADCRIAELRADGMPPSEIPGNLKNLRADFDRVQGRGADVILTIRLRRDGGAWDDSLSSEREKTWLSVLEKGDSFPGWLDVEAEEFPRLSARMRSALASGVCKVLLSHHDFKGCPPAADLRAQLRLMEKEGLSGFKAAVTCRSRGELLGLMEFAREAARVTPNASVFSMGAAGRGSRVLSPLLGCPLTYGYLTGAAVAPGQLSVGEMKAFYRGLPDKDWASAPVGELVDWAETRLSGGELA
jgi:3-dehydroquinate dehydratase type I